MKDLNYFRNKIRAMDFTPMADDELQIVLKKILTLLQMQGLKAFIKPKKKENFLI